MSASVRRPSPALVLAIGLLVAAVLCAGAVLIAKTAGGVSTGGDRYLSGLDLYTDPNSSAAQEIVAEPERADDFRPLVTTPTGVWLTPEKQPTASVENYVAGIAGAASSTATVPTFVVYGIPDRDCGSESAGGLDAAEYPDWVAAIADGVRGRDSIVILEPDSLALSASCGRQDARIAQVRAAASQFAGTGAEVYLDGGNSDWLGAKTMADLLIRAKVSSVRGFATNVANYNTSGRETKYANEVSRMTGGSHYVIDVSRNGAGSSGVWCNPAGRRLGEKPAINRSGGARDANLWIKPPGESDGTCNGGPAAGQWWDHSALELLGESG
ncbi:glycoside hydrolase family 6 protein [Lacisediminihabitans changchengi]|uniref:Glucanase n=1 Tax=Lacisediminihabitans changchengi TaxID=2787634 RepID=A0A934SK74_9MICO|nr:glycoside hydrolase family 6 protein [Lacisediminihabitans changchengi]MBK4346869.1 glycoside hydrolase family 6 protein [Lacisediminihabitans changchengi]MBK4348008.1 glycoside hydrolase family 6 protein [Lacisediminihabitans changchengi]